MTAHQEETVRKTTPLSNLPNPTASGIAQYENASAISGKPQENEILAFSIVTSQLAAANSEKERIRALHRNTKLWAFILQDIALSSNKLPEDLKKQIAQLGAWAMRYSTNAIAQRLPLEPLIAVNRNIIEGLRDQLARVQNLPRSEAAQKRAPDSPKPSSPERHHQGLVRPVVA